VGEFTSVNEDPSPRKTKLYRLYKSIPAGWQGGLRMTKDGIDAVGPAREPRSVDSPANTLLQAKHSLARGDRVQMSELGLARHPNYGDIQGLIVGEAPPSGWRIKFDERKRVRTIHSDYLEKVGDLAPISLVDDTVQEERSPCVEAANRGEANSAFVRTFLSERHHIIDYWLCRPRNITSESL
jgi:uncharacterized protein YbdZ (MbtH family)